MTQLLTTLWNDESGQDLAEYGLLLALVAVVVAGAILTFREDIVGAFNDAEAVLEGGATSTS